MVASEKRYSYIEGHGSSGSYSICNIRIYTAQNCSDCIKQDTDQVYIGGQMITRLKENHCKCVERKPLPYMNCHITTVFTRTPAASLTGKIDVSNAESKTHFISRGLTVSSMLNGLKL